MTKALAMAKAGALASALAPGAVLAIAPHFPKAPNLLRRQVETYTLISGYSEESFRNVLAWF